ncbi:hypothetical protein D3C85_1714850 [compost metagenome]
MRPFLNTRLPMSIPCKGDLGSVTAILSSSLRATFAALYTAPVRLFASCDPPATGALGKLVSPRVTFTKRVGTSNTSAAVWARIV